MNTRRNFLKTALSLSTMTAAGGFARLNLLNAMPVSSDPYRALVCVFLYGGNDSNNMVVQLDPTLYSKYAAIRAGLALDPTTLLPFDTNKQYGLHPMFKEVVAIAPNVAIVANVGTLVQPTTRTDYLGNNVPVPDSLFSHANQQGEWQTSDPAGLLTTGWGGRLADQMAHLNTGSYPTLVSVAGNSSFATGATTHPGSVIPGQPIGLTGFGTDAASQARLTALKTILGTDTVRTDAGAILLKQAGLNMQNALADSDTLNAALKGAAALKTVFPATSIGQQLQEIAKLIQVRDKLQMNRQIFFCSLGGFDTHTVELTTHNTLYSQLSPALAAFYQATEELNVANDVTAFTESDFSRTLQPNSNGGTDHGWGGHHLVIGGAVKGATLYGTFPTLALNGPDDAGGEGRWVPTTAVDQYGATLAQWFGLTPDKLPLVFPNIAKFPTNDVGFFG